MSLSPSTDSDGNTKIFFSSSLFLPTSAFCNGDSLFEVVIQSVPFSLFDCIFDTLLLSSSSFLMLFIVSFALSRRSVLDTGLSDFFNTYSLFVSSVLGVLLSNKLSKAWLSSPFCGDKDAIISSSCALTDILCCCDFISLSSSNSFFPSSFEFLTCISSIFVLSMSFI